MSIIDKAAEIAAKDFAKSQAGSAFDPSIILVFADILIQLVETFQDCKAANTPAEAAVIVKSPGPFQRLVARRVVKDVLGKQAFRQHGDEVLATLFRVGTTVTEQDMKEAFEEVQNS